MRDAYQSAIQVTDVDALTGKHLLPGLLEHGSWL